MISYDCSLAFLTVVLNLKECEFNIFTQLPYMGLSTGFHCKSLRFVAGTFQKLLCVSC